MQRRRSPEANQTLHDVWPSPGLLRYIYIFGGSCPLTEFCPVQNSPYVQVLLSPILAALLHGSRAVGLSQTLRRGTRNRIMELSQTAPSVFGWAAITLGIGPHCSCFFGSVRQTKLAIRQLSGARRPKYSYRIVSYPRLRFMPNA